MKKVILDTSFILSCVRNKIDFIEELKLIGFDVLIFKKVVEELKKSKKKESEISLKLLKNIEPIDFGNSHADKQIISFAEKNPDVAVATLDRLIKKSVKNKKIIIRNKKNLNVFS